MRFPVRPELTTASAVHGLSLTTTATVDNSAPFSNHPLALIYRGQSVQINRDTSIRVKILIQVPPFHLWPFITLKIYPHFLVLKVQW